MNPQTAAEAVRLARAEDAKGVVVCPPFVYISSIKREVSRAKVGAQDVFWEPRGAYTGEVSPAMLKKLGVEYVIIGHSERRAQGETDTMVNKKVAAALRAHLRVILCVGESKRESGSRNYELRKAQNYVKVQLKRDLNGIHNSKFKIHNSLIIAYEPVWAISTARSAKSQDNADTPENALLMIKFIKGVTRQVSDVRCRVLYGGSVTSQNAASFLHYRDVGGALVGGASLRADDFKKIIKTTKTL